MIVIDIESSGLNLAKNGIWQIGAIDLDTGEEFFEEAKIDDEDEIMKEALVLTGKTEQDLRDKTKQSQKQLIENFLNWVEKFDERILAGHNVGFDVMFIQNKCIEYNLREKFHKITGQRSIDLHTLANIIYMKKNKKFKKSENGKSSMNLSSVLEFCGLKDKRMAMSNGEVIKEGKPHDALEDSKLEAECFSRLVYGKNLLPEFKKDPVPEYLEQNPVMGEDK